jgi:hypothetical protein
MFTLVIDGAAMDILLKSPAGPVMRYGNVVGDKIIATARTKITRRAVGPAAPGAGGITLGNTLVKRWAVSDSGPNLTIAATAYYALWVHEGNQPNGPNGRIWPTKASVLRFVVPGGGFVFARSVRTNTPNPFLRQAMEEVVPLG